ncbi:glycosyl hydrolase family 18 protein [Frigoribacterium salinisoli]
MTRPLRAARAPVVALAAAVLLGATACTPLPASRASDDPDAPTGDPTFSVVGYAEWSTTEAQLDASASALTSVVVDGVNVAADGRTVSAPSQEALTLLARAHDRGERAELLVGNFDEELGDFSPAITDALLGSGANVDHVVEQLVAEVERHGWDGVTVDLESLTGAHPDGLTTLVSRLGAALDDRQDVSVCLMATTGSYLDLGYDLAGLGAAADHVVLMAYDQHGPTWNGVGPIGGTPWVEATLAPLREAVPASTIQLGVAGYGYTWPAEGTGEQVSVEVARTMVADAGADATWDDEQQEWHATLPDGTETWWSDRRSYEARLGLAREAGLGGVAVWSLSLADPLTH